MNFSWAVYLDDAKEVRRHSLIPAILLSLQQKWQIVKNPEPRYNYLFSLPTSLREKKDDVLRLDITWSPCWLALAVQFVPMDATSDSSFGRMTHQDWGGVTSQVSLTVRSSSLQQTKRAFKSSVDLFTPNVHHRACFSGRSELDKATPAVTERTISVLW